MNENGLDPTRLLWLGLIVLAAFGLGAALLGPVGRGPADEEATPAPSPETASLHCLDGRTYASIEELAGQPGPDGAPRRGRWTLSFAEGGFVMDRAGVREAGPYRCDGATVTATGSVGAHRGHRDTAADRLVWDSQGYERVQADATATDAPPPATQSSGADPVLAPADTPPATTGTAG